MEYFKYVCMSSLLLPLCITICITVRKFFDISLVFHSQNSQKKKNLCRNLFLDKVKLCRSATSLKMNLQSRCFLVKVAKFVEAPFPQDTTGQLLLIVAVSIVVKGELANKAVNYDTKTKAHIWTNLLKRAVHVKEQVSEAVTGRLQIRCS